LICSSTLRFWSARISSRTYPLTLRRLFGDRLQNDRLQVARDLRLELARGRGQLVNHALDQPCPVGLFIQPKSLEIR
jgi:hypothetical protein